MNRIPLQPEWDLIQRKIGALNALQNKYEFWCYEPWPGTNHHYSLERIAQGSDRLELVMSDLSMGLILDYLDYATEHGVESDVTVDALAHLKSLCAE